MYVYVSVYYTRRLPRGLATCDECTAVAAFSTHGECRRGCNDIAAMEKTVRAAGF